MARVLIAVTVVFALFAPSGASLAQEASPTPATVAVERIVPSNVQVSLLAPDFAVDVTVENVSELGAFEVLVTFDPAYLTYTGVEAGGFLTSTGRTAFCVMPSPQHTVAGQVRFGCGTFGMETPAPSGDGVLARVRFRARTLGETHLDLEPSLATVIGDTIPADAHGATVSITADVLPTPTPEPTPDPCDVDLDGDGRIGPGDIRLVAKAVGPASDDARFDVNHDGRVDSGDVRYLARLMRTCR